MKRFLLILIVSSLLFSCSLEDDGTNLSFETLPIKSFVVPDSLEFGTKEPLEITYVLPNECYGFEGVYYKYEGNTRVVAINAFISSQATCAENTVEQTHTFNVDVRQREDYIFKFWVGVDENGNNIFEEVTVPVIDNIDQ